MECNPHKKTLVLPNVHQRKYKNKYIAYVKNTDGILKN